MNQIIQKHNKIIQLIAVFIVSAILIGCNTPQQTVTYKSLYTVETTTKAEVDSYYALVVQGKIPTNDVPRVSKEFNSFQAAMKVAVDLNQNNTNAIAPANIVIESQDLLNLITSLKGAK